MILFFHFLSSCSDVDDSDTSLYSTDSDEEDEEVTHILNNNAYTNNRQSRYNNNPPTESSLHPNSSTVKRSRSFSPRPPPNRNLMQNNNNDAKSSALNRSQSVRTRPNNRAGSLPRLKNKGGRSNVYGTLPRGGVKSPVNGYDCFTASDIRSPNSQNQAETSGSNGAAKKSHKKLSASLLNLAPKPLVQMVKRAKSRIAPSAPVVINGPVYITSSESIGKVSSQSSDDTNLCRKAPPVKPPPPQVNRSMSLKVTSPPQQRPAFQPVSRSKSTVQNTGALSTERPTLTTVNNRTASPTEKSVCSEIASKAQNVQNSTSTSSNSDQEPPQVDTGNDFTETEICRIEQVANGETLINPDNSENVTVKISRGGCEDPSQVPAVDTSNDNSMNNVPTNNGQLSETKLPGNHPAIKVKTPPPPRPFSPPFRVISPPTTVPQAGRDSKLTPESVVSPTSDSEQRPPPRPSSRPQVTFSPERTVVYHSTLPRSISAEAPIQQKVSTKAKAKASLMKLVNKAKRSHSSHEISPGSPVVEQKPKKKYALVNIVDQLVVKSKKFVSGGEKEGKFDESDKFTKKYHTRSEAVDDIEMLDDNPNSPFSPSRPLHPILKTNTPQPQGSSSVGTQTVCETSTQTDSQPENDTHNGSADGPNEITVSAVVNHLSVNEMESQKTSGNGNESARTTNKNKTVSLGLQVNPEEQNLLNETRANSNVETLTEFYERQNSSANSGPSTSVNGESPSDESGVNTTLTKVKNDSGSSLKADTSPIMPKTKESEMPSNSVEMIKQRPVSPMRPPQPGFKQPSMKKNGQTEFEKKSKQSPDSTVKPNTMKQSYNQVANTQTKVTIKPSVVTNKTITPTSNEESVKQGVEVCKSSTDLKKSKEEARQRFLRDGAVPEKPSVSPNHSSLKIQPGPQPSRPATSPVRFTSTKQSTSISTSPHPGQATSSNTPKSISKTVSNTLTVSTTEKPAKVTLSVPPSDLTNTLLSPETNISPDSKVNGIKTNRDVSMAAMKAAEYVNANMNSGGQETKCDNSTAAISVLKTSRITTPAKTSLPAQPRTATGMTHPSRPTTLPNRPVSPARPSSLPNRPPAQPHQQVDIVKGAHIKPAACLSVSSSLETEAIGSFAEPSLVSQLSHDTDSGHSEPLSNSES